MNLFSKDSIRDEYKYDLYNRPDTIEIYYKEADCCLLMYDITSMESFDKVKNYYVETIKNMCKKGIKIILLGNKTDLKNQRQVSDVDGKDLAEEKSLNLI